MDTEHRHDGQHAHGFGQDRKRPGEAKTIIVIAMTSAMMVIEIIAGLAYGSMALLADGLHMASHSAALFINLFAYVYARRHAHDPSYSFGTGKVNALGGFTGAILLMMFALLMGWQSIDRLIYPVDIAFNQAIIVAVAGLIVNGISVFILGHDDDHGHDHGHDHHGHSDHGHDDHHDHDDHDDDHKSGHQDHNLRAAYLHVLADALTSLLAIGALLAAKFFGLNFMDPLMGIVGAILVSRWSYGLLRTTGAVLLDKQAPASLQRRIREHMERDSDDRVTDLHIWSIGPNIYSAILSMAADEPRSPAHYKQRIPDGLGLVHVSIEVNPSGSNERQI